MSVQLCLLAVPIGEGLSALGVLNDEGPVDGIRVANLDLATPDPDRRLAAVQQLDDGRESPLGHGQPEDLLELGVGAGFSLGACRLQLIAPLRKLGIRGAGWKLLRRQRLDILLLQAHHVCNDLGLQSALEELYKAPDVGCRQHWSVLCPALLRAQAPCRVLAVGQPQGIGCLQPSLRQPVALVDLEGEEVAVGALLQVRRVRRNQPQGLEEEVHPRRLRRRAVLRGALLEGQGHRAVARHVQELLHGAPPDAAERVVRAQLVLIPHVNLDELCGAEEEEIFNILLRPDRIAIRLDSGCPPLRRADSHLDEWVGGLGHIEVHFGALQIISLHDRHPQHALGTGVLQVCQVDGGVAADGKGLAVGRDHDARDGVVDDVAHGGVDAREVGNVADALEVKVNLGRVGEEDLHAPDEGALAQERPENDAEGAIDLQVGNAH
mmetsp:Transcript_47230/g.145431  ORF Transcript_47230/g.145431 Transcript_47230/m.145431 type:complete len:437 (+) Transcript_47230:87-1397(+)